MVYDLGAYLHKSLSPYLWSKTTKNNTSSLYLGKSGIVRLASMYPLYGIEMPPIPSRHNTSPIKFLMGRILNPIFVQSPPSEGRDLGPSIHQCCHFHLYHNHCLIGTAK